eukprot:373419-Prymnesium_polylepis.1
MKPQSLACGPPIKNIHSPPGQTPAQAPAAPADSALTPRPARPQRAAVARGPPARWAPTERRSQPPRCRPRCRPRDRPRDRPRGPPRGPPR